MLELEQFYGTTYAQRCEEKDCGETVVRESHQKVLGWLRADSPGIDIQASLHGFSTDSDNLDEFHRQNDDETRFLDRIGQLCPYVARLPVSGID